MMQPGYPNQTAQGAGFGGYPPPGTQQQYNYGPGAGPNPTVYNGGGDVTYVSIFSAIMEFVDMYQHKLLKCKT